jgi:hypothetical protein
MTENWNTKSNQHIPYELIWNAISLFEPKNLPYGYVIYLALRIYFRFNHATSKKLAYSNKNKFKMNMKLYGHHLIIVPPSLNNTKERIYKNDTNRCTREVLSFYNTSPHCSLFFYDVSL